MPDTRIAYLDNLRSFLIILVILHHVALVYGAFAPFYYVEPPFGQALTYKLLLLFGLVNQAWFMGALFFIAGLFTPGALERKGAALFIRERLVKLGGASLVYYLIVSPVASGALWLMPRELTGISAPLNWRAYPRLLGLGPLWFAVLLLIFSLGYALFFRRTGERDRRGSAARKYNPVLLLAAVILTVALLSYLIRIVLPVGRDFIGFPSLAYLPQYLACYCAGVVFGRRGTLPRIKRSHALIAATGGAVATLLLFPAAFSGSPFSLELNEGLGLAMGSGHWRSALYALWDTLAAAALLTLSLGLFQHKADRASRLSRLLSRESFAVYIFHIPVVVYVAWLIHSLPLSNLAKFGLLSAVAVTLCFFLTALVRRMAHPLALIGRIGILFRRVHGFGIISPDPCRAVAVHRRDGRPTGDHDAEIIRRRPPVKHSIDAVPRNPVQWSIRSGD